MATNADRTRRWYNEVWKSGDEFLAERARLLGAFPDLVIEVDDVIEQGPVAVARLKELGAPGA